MDTAKLNEVIEAAGKVTNAATELLNDAESDGKLALFVEELDSAAAVFDELAEELVPSTEEGEEEEPEEPEEEPEPEPEPAEGDKQNDTLREWAGLPTKE